MNQALDAYERLKDVFLSCTGSCLKSSSTLTLNGRRFKIHKLLGEGGFSFVYLAEDETSGRLFALKKIRCPLGSESVREAMKEVEAYKRFRHPNCIRCLDSAVLQETDGKVIYLFLPYYKKGNLQDAIAANSVNGTRFPERDMLSLFLGTCQAVESMHTYTPGSSISYPPSQTRLGADTSGGNAASSSSNSTNKGKGRAARDEDERDSSVLFEQQEEEEEEAIRAAAGAAEPLIGSMDRAAANDDDDDDAMHDVDESGAKGVAGLGETSGHLLGRLPNSPSPSMATHHNGQTAPQQQQNKQTLQPWAHRDIKPANVMVTDEGNPILMDFGSALPARIYVDNRSTALKLADDAAEHCSMPYRAPELFDPPVGGWLDEKVDIWSLGCTLYAMAYGHSPFEVEGSSVVLAVQNGQYRFPQSDKVYTQGLRDLIAFMLVVDKSKRPNIHQVIERTQQALSRVQ